MKHIILITQLIVISALTMNLCKASDDVDTEVHRLMGWLDSADAVKDARKALHVGDTRLWAVRGVVVYLPGVKEKDKMKIAKKYGYRIIKGASDGLVSDEHARLNKAAREYALEYNTYVLSNLSN